MKFFVMLTGASEKVINRNPAERGIYTCYFIVACFILYINMNTLRARRFKTLISSTLIVLSIGIGLAVTFAYAQTDSAVAPSNHRPPSSGSNTSGMILSGYAWSTNIGWIRMSNCSSATDCAGQSYGVSVASSGANRPMTGYAWSSNIGWISFNPSAVKGCPMEPCQASINWNDGTVSGWARACSVFANTDCTYGSLKDDSARGGWDGFISLNGPLKDNSSKFGVFFNTSTNTFTGQGWGSDVVGWVDFTGVKTVDPECEPGDMECYCEENPDAEDCKKCEPGDMDCYCEENPDAEDCKKCEPGDMDCYCEENPDAEKCKKCELDAAPGTDCWCSSLRNKLDPNYNKYCKEVDMCINVEGDQRAIPSGAHVTSTNRCLCDTGNVLKKDTVTGLYSCVDLHYNEVKR